MIAIIAVLCSLSSPANCHEQTVTTSDFADVSMQSCLMGAPQLAEWMNQHPAERLAAWRRVLPAAIVMTADDMVDAALAGLDQGEVVTIPSLADKADWDLYEAARRAMSGKL
jgi:short-subunit dehydrogenase